MTDVWIIYDKSGWWWLQLKCIGVGGWWRVKENSPSNTRQICWTWLCHTSLTPATVSRREKLSTDFIPEQERKYLDWRQVSHWPRPTVTYLKRLANSQLKEAAMKKSSSRGKSYLLNSRHHEEISPYSTQRILREFLFPNDNRSRLTKRDSFQESKNQNKETSCCF